MRECLFCLPTAPPDFVIKRSINKSINDPLLVRSILCYRLR